MSTIGKLASCYPLFTFDILIYNNMITEDGEGSHNEATVYHQT